MEKLETIKVALEAGQRKGAFSIKDAFIVYRTIEALEEDLKELESLRGPRTPNKEPELTAVEEA